MNCCTQLDEILREHHVGLRVP